MALNEMMTMRAFVDLIISEASEFRDWYLLEHLKDPSAYPVQQSRQQWADEIAAWAAAKDIRNNQ